MTRATLLGHVETMLQQMEYMSSSLATSVPGSERVGGRMRGAGRLTATSDGDVTSGRVAGVPGGGHRRGHTGGAARPSRRGRGPGSRRWRPHGYQRRRRDLREGGAAMPGGRHRRAPPGRLRRAGRA